jgi:twitching motility protein PilT
MNKVVESITPTHLRKRADEDREVDFSYYVPGTGRFRTNLFQQRGQWCLAMRYVKTHVGSFQELGLLEQIKKIAESPRRHRARGWRHLAAASPQRWPR